jgi:hypothetical protein
VQIVNAVSNCATMFYGNLVAILLVITLLLVTTLLAGHSAAGHAGVGVRRTAGGRPGRPTGGEGRQQQSPRHSQVGALTASPFIE